MKRLFLMLCCSLVGALLMGVAFPTHLNGQTEVPTANLVSFAYSITPKPHVTVTNNYKSPLTGIVAVVSDTSGRLVEAIWFDSGINFHHDYPLQTGDSKSFPVGSIPANPTSSLQPKLMAVLFEDGTSAGDSDWLSKIHSRRKVLYDEIQSVTGVLDQAVAQHETNDEIVSALDGMQSALESSITETDIRRAANLVLAFTIDNLKRGGVSGSIGDPQKTIPMAIIPAFSDWRGALKRYEPGLT